MKYTQKMHLLTEEQYARLLKKSEASEAEEMCQEESTISTPNTTREPSAESEEKTDETKLSKEIILSSIPKTHKSRASSLLNHIEHIKVLTWNRWGEVIYKAKLLPHSQIVDLLRDALKEQRFVPAGSTEFYSALAESNVPLALISNAKRQKDLQSKPSEFQEKGEEITSPISEEKPITTKTKQVLCQTVPNWLKF